MSGPCATLRVIDLSSGQTGGLATMVLADFGADVIKVEPPGGDPLRTQPSATMWLRGKRSVELDLRTPEARQQLHTLVHGADVVVSSYAPGEAEAVEADYATLSALNGGLVYCSITGWGPEGVYAHYPADEALVAAKSGRMRAFTGVVRRDGPACPAVQVGSHGATQAALTGTLAALLVRERTGAGQLVQTSLLQGMFPFDFRTLMHTQLLERYPDHVGSDPYAIFQQDTMPTLGYQPVAAQDGRWIQFANLLEHLFLSSLDALGLAEQVLGDPRYSDAPRGLTPEALEEVRNLMLESARERPAEEWMRIFQENGNVAAEIIGTAQQGLYNIDMEANREIVEMEHPELGTVRQLGLLARLAETPGTVGGPSPTPGAHTDEVLNEAPRAPWSPPASAVTLATAGGPLAGVTIVEFATIIAAPLGAAMLGDLGARVIKVEPVNGGDPMRGLGVGLGAMFGVSKTTASKESICLDLKSEQGQRIAQQLLAQADVVVHNYRPGVPERLGIGYEQARALRPDIVYLGLNGYGPDGPGARRPSAHPIPGAVAGGALMQAGSGWPPDDIDDLDVRREASRQFSRANESNPDPNTAMVVASTALLGLYARQATGKGQQLFLTMLGANGYANAEDFLAYEGKPERPSLDAWLYGQHALHRLYEARDGWVFLSVNDGAQWAALCTATGQAALAAEPRFRTAEARREADEALAGVLSALFATGDADEWERVLIAAGIGCVRADGYRSAGDFFLNDPHVQANRWMPEVEHAQWGRYRRWGTTLTCSATPLRPGPGVLAGQHGDAILAELGYDQAAIAELHADGVTWAEQPLDLGTPVASATAR